MGLFHRRFLSFLRDGCLTAALMGLVWLNAFHPTEVAAQSQPAPSGVPHHYFLFIVESSRAMQPRLQGSLDVMQGLLNTAFNGQMRPGDILDAWAFNDAVIKAGPPSRADTQEARATLSVRLLDFVMSQAADKKTSLDKVTPNLNNLLRDSPLITVILITSGENNMQGTACDGLINNAYRRLHDQQQKMEKPLVTVLRAVQGQVTDCKVIAAPGPITLPSLPDPALFRTETNPTTAAAPEPVKPPLPVAPRPKTLPATVSAKPTNTAPARTNRAVESKPVFEPRVTELATATSEVPPVATPPPAPATSSPPPSVAEIQAPRTETPTKPETLLASTDSSAAAAQLAATRIDAAAAKPEAPPNKLDVSAAEPQPLATKPDSLPATKSEPVPAKEETKAESSLSQADPPPRSDPPPASDPPKAAVETPAAPVETAPSVPVAPVEASKQPDVLASAPIDPPPPQPASFKPAPPEKASTPGMVAVSLPPPAQRSFLRENGKFLLLSGLAMLGAAFCFYNWFKTYLHRFRR